MSQMGTCNVCKTPNIDVKWMQNMESGIVKKVCQFCEGKGEWVQAEIGYVPGRGK